MKFTNVSIRVRYAETDQMGFVYYGNYATYFEVARVEFFRKLGLSYKKLEEGGVIMPVLKLEINFIAPAKYDDLLNIKISIAEMSGVRIGFDYEIYNESNQLLTKAYTQLVFLDNESRKPVKIPQKLIDAVENQ